MLTYNSAKELADDIKAAILDYPSNKEEVKIMENLAKAADNISTYIYGKEEIQFN